MRKPYVEGELPLSYAASASYHCAHGRVVWLRHIAHTAAETQWEPEMYTVVRGIETCAEGILYAESETSIPSSCGPSLRTRKDLHASVTYAYVSRNAMGSGEVHGCARK